LSINESEQLSVIATRQQDDHGGVSSVTGLIVVITVCLYRGKPTLQSSSQPGQNQEKPK
jgi:hypothetical protein